MIICIILSKLVDVIVYLFWTPFNISSVLLKFPEKLARFWGIFLGLDFPDENFIDTYICF